jgi:glycosyltransferase involved in cell wall biosynthesis
MSKPLSVIICTHNPRIEYLNRVIETLKSQTLSTEMWDFVLIDNACNPPLSECSDLYLPNFCKIIVEPKLGLTPARIRGIKETLGELILFVDDDNLLAHDYLEQLLMLHQHHPHIGVWSGNIDPIFETEPAEWTKPYLPYLALRQVNKEVWSNCPKTAPLPCGAGMSVRRDVAMHYCADATANPLRFMMGRKGKSLLSGEDTDIGLTACDLGLGVGSSPKLKLQHIIPTRRIQLTYLNNLVESTTYSHHLLFLSRGLMNVGKKQVWKLRMTQPFQFLRLGSYNEFLKYKRRGHFRALLDFYKFQANGNLPS